MVAACQVLANPLPQPCGRCFFTSDGRHCPSSLVPLSSSSSSEAALPSTALCRHSVEAVTLLFLLNVLLLFFYTYFTLICYTCAFAAMTSPKCPPWGKGRMQNLKYINSNGSKHLVSTDGPREVIHLSCCRRLLLRLGTFPGGRGRGCRCSGI